MAAGLAPVAVGTETDGSIVSPASACDVVGLMPTVGLISRTGLVPVSVAQDTAGPITGSVADAAAMLTAMADQDPADPATAPAASHQADYASFLDPDALAGARLGVWREGSRAASAVLDAAVARLRSGGAEIVDPVRLHGAEAIEEPEMTALLYEFGPGLNAYLSALPGDRPVTLAELIDFNRHNADSVLAYFGQELFEMARLARAALDSALAGRRLDAIVALVGGPAWLTGYALGDHVPFRISRPTAVSGHPALCVNAGFVHGLPVGLTFMGPAWGEPRLLGLAFAFERRQVPPVPAEVTELFPSHR